jgi:hypothetical protein
VCLLFCLVGSAAVFFVGETVAARSCSSACGWLYSRVLRRHNCCCSTIISENWLIQKIGAIFTSWSWYNRTFFGRFFRFSTAKGARLVFFFLRTGLRN